MRKISTGSVYQKSYTDRQGQTRKTTTWYLKYYVSGPSRPIDVSTGTDDYDQAVAMLRQKVARSAARGYKYTADVDRVTVDQLLDLVIEDYQLNKRDTTYDTEKRIDKHLRPFFGDKRAIEIGTKVLKAYRVHRQQGGGQPATINKELTFLRRGFRLGLEHEPRLVGVVPHFPIAKVENAREGILSHDSYRAIRDRLPSYARISAVISYHTGARKGEIRKIRKERIDLDNGRIELTGKTTKNKKGRYLPIYDDMAAEIEMAISVGDPRCPLLVQREGKPVIDFEKSWKTACEASGVDETIFHDLWRTAITNMIEAGYSEKDAMEISGHKTRAVFDRYNIVSAKRIRSLAEKIEAFLKDKEERLQAPPVQDAGASHNRRLQ